MRFFSLTDRRVELMAHTNNYRSRTDEVQRGVPVIDHVATCLYWEFLSLSRPLSPSLSHLFLSSFPQV